MPTVSRQQASYIADRLDLAGSPEARQVILDTLTGQELLVVYYVYAVQGGSWPVGKMVADEVWSAYRRKVDG